MAPSVKPDRRISRLNPLIISTIIVAAAVIAMALIFFNWNRIVHNAAEKIFAGERAQYEEKIARLEKDIETLAESPPEGAKNTAPTENGTAPQPEARTADRSGQKSNCALLEKKIINTISDLEDRPYIAKYHLPNGLLPKLESIRRKLLAHPPIVVRETDSLYSILTNTAHFYRILGKNDLALLRDLITGENDHLEDILDTFYHWSKKDDDCGKKSKLFRLPLEQLYEYAGFFLNTLGGRAYIFRRDTRVRILVRYYCIMIIDRANSNIINRHGIDLRPAVDSLIRELKAAPPLKYRERYLARLMTLKGRYAADRGTTP